jgi:hypothetical protein
MRECRVGSVTKSLSSWVDGGTRCAIVLFALLAGCAGGANGGESYATTSATGATNPSGAGEPGAEDGGSAADPAVTNPPSVSSPIQASVTYPFLIPAPNGAPDYFPTAFAHLLGQTLTWTDISTSFACISLTNSTASPVEVTLRVELVGYSTPLEQSVIVPASYTVTPCLNPTPSLDLLYQLSSPIPGQVHTTVTPQGSTTPLLDDLHSVTITTGQTVFNGEETPGGYQPLYKYQAVLSMPKDPWVQSLLTPAAARSAWGTFGVGGYNMHVDENKNPIPRSEVNATIAKGAYQLDSAYFMAGESITLNLDTISWSGEPATIDFYAFKESTSSPTSTLSLDGMPLGVVRAPGSAAGQRFTITAPTEGQYDIVFFNSSPNSLSVAYHRTGTAADTVIDALQSVYDELQSWNITYVNIASSYFDPSASQSVRWPSTIRTDLAANCIDGSMLFASILEAMQLEPVVVFIPGHAFMGVRQGPGASLIWPVETTMVGTSSFLSAFGEGLSEYNNQTVPEIALMDIKAARLAGVTPIPE